MCSAHQPKPGPCEKSSPWCQATQQSQNAPANRTSKCQAALRARLQASAACNTAHLRKRWAGAEVPQRTPRSEAASTACADSRGPWAQHVVLCWANARQQQQNKAGGPGSRANTRPVRNSVLSRPCCRAPPSHDQPGCQLPLRHTRTAICRCSGVLSSGLQSSSIISK